MAGMSWEQYYDGFYEWSTGTQIRYLARLESYGSGAQTAEIAAELAEAGDGGPAAAKRLIMRAVENGVRFAAEDVIEMAGADIEEDTLKYALATVREPLTGGQIVTLSDYFDDDVLEKLIKDKRGGLTPEEMSSIDDRDMSDGKLARAMAAAEPRLSPGQILALMYALDEETLSRAVTESREPFTPEQITELTDYVSEKALSEAVMKAKEAFTPEQVSDLLYYVDEDALSKAVRSTKEPFTPEQIIELVALKHIGMHAEYARADHALLALSYPIVYTLQRRLYFKGKAAVLIAKERIHKYNFTMRQLFLYTAYCGGDVFLTALRSIVTAVVAPRHKHHKVGVMRYYLVVHILHCPLRGGAAHGGICIFYLDAVYIGECLFEHFGETVLVGSAAVHT